LPGIYLSLMYIYYFAIIESIELAKFTYDQAHKLDRMREILTVTPGLVIATDGNRDTLLHHAAFNGNLEMCKLLIDRGANITARNDDDQTPYDLAEHHRVNTEGMIEDITNKELL